MDKLTKEISKYKKEIFKFENPDKKGLIILDRKDKVQNQLIERLYLDAKKISKKESQSELNELLKEALRSLLLRGKVGAVLIQAQKVVIRGAVNEESNEELLELIFQSEHSFNEFIYHGIYDYLTLKINIEFLSIDKLLNRKAEHKFLLTKLIEVSTKNHISKEALKSSSIKLDDLKQKNSRSYKRFDSLVQFILDNSISNINSPLYIAIADFLIRSIANASASQLKYMKEFFDNKINDKKSRSRQINFNVIRRNAVDREKYLKLIDDANSKIKEAKDRENHFIQLAESGKGELERLKKELDSTREEMDRAHRESKEAFDRREVVRKSPNGAKSDEYKELSEAVRNYAIKKSNLDVEVKNLQQKYSQTKQSIENAIDDRVDYMKLLPEMVGVQDKKIRDYELNLQEFKGDYENAKEIIVERLYNIALKRS